MLNFNKKLARLPRYLRENWHIYDTLRTEAMGCYAREEVEKKYGRSIGSWGLQHFGVFNDAAKQWRMRNPETSGPFPLGEPWPKGAETRLGNEAFEKARRLMGFPPPSVSMKKSMPGAV